MYPMGPALIQLSHYLLLEISMTDRKQNFPSSHRALLPNLLKAIDTRPLHVVGIVMAVGILLAMNSITRSALSLKSGETDTWWMIALNLVHGHGYSLCLTSYFPFCSPTNQVTAMREPVPVF